ncbi:hypothetical protein FBQ87_15770 [Sphingobacteriales bacterium CHB3]|nr:hypothetical protein [Sphingobacteriales bacterium CHB3]
MSRGGWSHRSFALRRTFSTLCLVHIVVRCGDGAPPFISRLLLHFRLVAVAANVWRKHAVVFAAIACPDALFGAGVTDAATATLSND